MGDELSSLYTSEVMEWNTKLPMFPIKVDNFDDLQRRVREDLGLYLEIQEDEINPNYSEFFLPKSHGRKKVGYRHKDNYFLGRPDIIESEKVRGLEILCDACKKRLNIVPLR